MRKETNRLLSAPAQNRSGDKRPSPGSEAANSGPAPPAQRPLAQPRASLAQPLAFGLSPPPRLQGSQASLPTLDSGATSRKQHRARRQTERRARCGEPGAPGSPNARYVRLRGLDAGCGRAELIEDDPHPLSRPGLRASWGAPGSPRPLLRLLDLARILKAGPGGTPASGRSFRRRPRSGRERLPLDLCRCLLGCGGSKRMEGLRVLGEVMLYSLSGTPNTE